MVKNMKCFYHEDREAVSQCVDCGKFLCKECASKYKPILCDDCYEERIAQNQANNIAWAQQVERTYKLANLFFLVPVIAMMLLGIINEGGIGKLLSGINSIFAYLILGVIAGMVGVSIALRNNYEILVDNVRKVPILVYFIFAIPRYINICKLHKQAQEILKNK